MVPRQPGIPAGQAPCGCCHVGPCADNTMWLGEPTRFEPGIIVPVLHAQRESGATVTSPNELKRILRLEVPVIVKLAERKLTVAEVMRLGSGAIIEFFKSSEEPLELLVNNKPIGVGEAVKVGENFGLKITQIGDVKQIIRMLGGQKG